MGSWAMSNGLTGSYGYGLKVYWWCYRARCDIVWVHTHCKWCCTHTHTPTLIMNARTGTCKCTVHTRDVLQQRQLKRICDVIDVLLKSTLLTMFRSSAGAMASEQPPFPKCALCQGVIRGVPMVRPRASRGQVVHSGCVPGSEAGETSEAPGYRPVDNGFVFDPLVLTLHITADTAWPAARLAVSCTSMAGDELAAACCLCPYVSLTSVRVPSLRRK